MRPSQLMPGVSDAVLAPHAAWLTPHFVSADGRLILAQQSHVISTPGHTIVVDTSLGKNPLYLERFKRLGVSLDDVDTVVCTHLHFDHVGWNTRLRDGHRIATFPRAKYLIPRPDWDLVQSMAPPSRLFAGVRSQIEPLLEAGRAHLVDGDEEIDRHVRLEAWPGHTPGHSCVVVDDGPARAVLCGDLLQHPSQCIHPEWEVGAADAEGSEIARREFLERCARTGDIVIPAHLPSPGLGRIERAGDAYRFVELYR